VTAFIARRALYAIVAMFLASIIIFYGLRVAPGAPDNTLFNPFASLAAKQALRQKLGLNDPLVLQYLHFLRNLVHGNLGSSIKSGQPIPTLLAQYGKNSLLLVASAAFLTYALSIPLGIIAATHRGRWPDHAIMFFASIGMGIPNFFLGLLLSLIVGLQFGWLPMSGSGGIEYLILPAIALAAEGVAVSLRLMRSSVLEQLDQDYVRALRARGLRGRTVIWRRVSRNALIPIISLAGIQIGALIGYTAIVEIIFRYPGLGQLLVSAVLQRDYPVALWLSLLLTASVIVVNFLANIGYALADPRIRVSSDTKNG
jgi:ABC-type dipeptide/oligopeptide/nickel transport system permease component